MKIRKIICFLVTFHVCKDVILAVVDCWGKSYAWTYPLGSKITVSIFEHFRKFQEHSLLV